MVKRLKDLHRVLWTKAAGDESVGGDGDDGYMESNDASSARSILNGEWQGIHATQKPVMRRLRGYAEEEGLCEY